MAGTAAEDEDEEEEEEQLPFYVILDAAWPQATVVFCRNAVGLTGNQVSSNNSSCLSINHFMSAIHFYFSSRGSYPWPSAFPP